MRPGLLVKYTRWQQLKDNKKHLVSVHEAGHAIVALYLKPDKLSTATIIPQGQSKGHTRMNREGKKCLLYSRVSTEMQVDGYSLEAQKNCLKRKKLLVKFLT